MSKVFALFSRSVVKTKGGKLGPAIDAGQAIHASYNAKYCVVARIVLDIEARLQHETVAQDCGVGATASLETKPRNFAVALLHATRAESGATHVWLVGNVENLLALTICEATRAEKAITPSTRCLARALKHVLFPCASEDTVDFFFHRHLVVITKGSFKRLTSEDGYELLTTRCSQQGYTWQ